jgi:hypothetical protein
MLRFGKLLQGYSAISMDLWKLTALGRDTTSHPVVQALYLPQLFFHSRTTLVPYLVRWGSQDTYNSSQQRN